MDRCGRSMSFLVLLALALPLGSLGGDSDGTRIQIGHYCLTNYNDVRANGNPVALWQCHDMWNSRQLWTLTTHGQIQLRADKRFCLTNLNDIRANGNPVELYECSEPGNVTSQTWSFTSAPSQISLTKTAVLPTASDKDWCLTNWHNIHTNGNRVDLWSCDSAFPQQQWTFTLPWNVDIHTLPPPALDDSRFLTTPPPSSTGGSHEEHQEEDDDSKDNGDGHGDGPSSGLMYAALILGILGLLGGSLALGLFFKYRASKAQEAAVAQPPAIALSDGVPTPGFPVSVPVAGQVAWPVDEEANVKDDLPKVQKAVVSIDPVYTF